MRKTPALAIAALLVALFLFWPRGAEEVAPKPDPAPQAILTQKPVKLSPPVRSFREWVDAYSAKPDEETLAQGKAYAKEHTKEIRRLIFEDPQLAIESAVPMVVRQKLPKEILVLLEDRVRVRGDYEVYGNVPPEGQQVASAPHTRTITNKDGKRGDSDEPGNVALQVKEA